MIILFYFLALNSLPAHALQMKASIDCSPGRALERPLRSGWATLYEVVRVLQTSTVDGDRHSNEVALTSRYLSSWTKKEELSTDVYVPGSAPANDKTLSYANPGRSANLHLDTLSFHVTRYDVPFTAGPLPPGSYSARAVLHITSSFLEKPGSEELQVDSRRVEMDCNYTIAYGL